MESGHLFHGIPFRLAHTRQNLTTASAGHSLQVKLSALNSPNAWPLTSTCRPRTFGIGCLAGFGFVSLHVGA
jgi:hypothetical protein